MDAKELRLDNFLLLDNKKFVRVIWFRLGYVCIMELGTEYPSAIVNLDRLKPIPLTEEWLLKFGFTNYENESWFWSFDFNDKQETFKVFPLTAGGVPMGLWGVVGCPQLVKKIEFVHQLQNLYFALTGEELTLKN